MSITHSQRNTHLPVPLKHQALVTFPNTGLHTVLQPQNCNNSCLYCKFIFKYGVQIDNAVYCCVATLKFLCKFYAVITNIKDIIWY